MRDVESNEYYHKQYQSTSATELETKEHSSLTRSSQMINEYINSGKETLSELSNQKDRLKNVHKNVLTILNSLGVSKDVIRSIENRENYDYLLVIFGMIFISAVLLLIYWLR